MAEIIDSEKIRQKLKEFDAYMQQNIETLKTLKQIRVDSEKMFSALQKKETFISQMDANLIKLQKKAENITDELARLVESKGKEIADFINGHRQEAETLKSEIVKFKEKNSREIADFVNKYENELDSRFKKVTSSNEMYEANIKILIDENIQRITNEIEFFKSHIKTLVNSNKENTDKEITDFLYKQNALVSNLNQQIDSYHKMTETLKEEFARQAEEIKNLRGTEVESQNQITALTAQNIDITNKLIEIMDELKKPLIKKLFGAK